MLKRSREKEEFCDFLHRYNLKQAETELQKAGITTLSALDQAEFSELLNQTKLSGDAIAKLFVAKEREKNIIHELAKIRSLAEQAREKRLKKIEAEDLDETEEDHIDYLETSNKKNVNQIKLTTFKCGSERYFHPRQLCYQLDKYKEFAKTMTNRRKTLRPKFGTKISSKSAALLSSLISINYLLVNNCIIYNVKLLDHESIRDFINKPVEFEDIADYKLQLANPSEIVLI